MTTPRTIAVLTSDPEGPVVRHRFLAYAEALAERAIALEVVPWPKDGVTRRATLRRIAAVSATVVSSRLLARWDVGRIVRRTSRLGFDFDDALSFRDSRRGATRSRNRALRFGRLVRAADRVTAGNAYLAALAARAGRAATVLPTTVPTTAAATPPPDAAEGVVIGWIGARATLPYLHALDEVWPAASEVPLRLRVVADAAPDLARVPVEHVPWKLATWPAALAGTHFGVAPLPDDPWTRGKCGLKVLQMQALGRAVVASPVGVQAEQVGDGISGFLPTSPAEFSSRIAQLARDDALRATMGAAAHVSVRDAWSTQAWASAFCDEMEALLG